MNVYAPNHDEPEFFLSLLEKVTNVQSDHVVLGGDLNIWLNPELDKKGGGKSKHSGSAVVVNNFLEEFEWIDVWRHANPTTFQFTWKRKKPFIGTRLDYFLVPLVTLANVTSIEIIPGCNSDHLFVEMLLEFENTSRGKGYWKMNTSLLRDRQYLEGINELIDKYETHENLDGDSDEALDWEMFKHKVFSFSRKYAKSKAGERKLQMANLEKKIQTQEKRLAMLNLSAIGVVKVIESINLKIEKLRTELNKHLEYIVQGALLRSKVRWFVQGEHCTSYFCSLEKMKAKGKQMVATRRHDGSITKNTSEILEIQSAFYRKLYTSDSSVQFEQTNSENIKLTKDQKTELDGPITLKELGEAISQMPRNKSPGADGIPADFYKVFWYKLKHRMLSLFSYCYQVKRFHTTARQGVITIIPKSGRDILLVRNWRPISLLCCDYKVISKVISNRIRKVLDTIIHTDQNGFVSGRNISNNIRKAYDILDHVSRKNISAVLISVDFEKAFDRVEYESLYKSMEYFGFGEVMTSWMRMFFTDFQLTVSNAGYSSPWFEPTRGLFQGNPIGPNAFLLLVEILAINLRRSKNIKTIRINDVVQLLSQFADDMDIYMQYDQKSWEEVMSDFERSSGMRVNYDKTTVYRIGSIRGTNAKFYSAAKLRWTNEPINVLGVWVSNVEQENIDMNLKPIIEKAKTLLDMWYHRGLSFFGKILVINTLVASLFTYRLSVIRNVPNNYVKEIEVIFRTFIWDNKTPKIKWEVVKGLRKDGGAGLVDIKRKDEAQKLEWAFKCQNSQEVAARAYEALNNQVGEILWSCTLKEKDIRKLFSVDHFWGDVLILWMKHNYWEPNQGKEVKDQILWLNSAIQIGERPVYIAEFVKAGVKKIGDILQGTKFLTYEEMKRRYSLNIPFTLYAGLLSAIPKHWKKMLKSKEVGSDKKGLSLKEGCEVQKKRTGRIYRYIVGNENLLKGYFYKWKMKVENVMRLEWEDWRKAVGEINKLTNWVKLRSFQYKLLLGILTTNVQLLHYKIKDTNLCTFCNIEIETLYHLFWECNELKPIWDWFIVNYDVELSFAKVLYSNLHSTNKLVDTLSLIAKYYIYRTRCMKKRICKVEFIEYCEQVKFLESQVSNFNNKRTLHDQKWSEISEY